MRVLVTGASGFVGRHLVTRLQAGGHEVAATWDDAPPEIEGVDPHRADVRRPDELAAAVAATRPDRIVHLAGMSHVGASWTRMAEYWAVNVDGTENVLKAAAGTPVLFASSAEIYGVVPEAEQPIEEERPAAPASPYALTKAAAERLVLLRGGLVMRPFNLVGPGQAPRFALPTFAGQLAAIARGAAEPVLRVGNLAARRDFVHVEDGVEAMAILVERGRPGTTYQIASGEAHAIEEVLDLLRATSGVRVTVEVDPERLRPVDIPLLLGTASRLRELGWEPRRGLRRAVEDLWREALASGKEGTA